MALKALPLLFYNLGGEMLYVIEQRLQAQNIPRDRSEKVISDIVCTMFKPQFLQELLMPQPLYSKQAMKTMFNKLVHSSIMKVGSDSMDKLYDLMVMSVKYQTEQCPLPRSILCVTLNHFDEILKYISSNPPAAIKIKEASNAIVDRFGCLSDNEFVLIRQAMLSFFQDTNNKVSIFMQQKLQKHNGKFVICTSGHVPLGSAVPGHIHIYHPTNKSTVSFDCGGSYKTSNKSDVTYTLGGQRSTSLGFNIYANAATDCLISANKDAISVDEDHNLAKAELGLLAKLIGSDVKNTNAEFRLQLFDSVQLSPPSASTNDSVHNTSDKVLNIKASSTGTEHLSQVVEDLTILSNTRSASVGEELLSLMDS